jgi:hypothetical protein
MMICFSKSNYNNRVVSDHVVDDTVLAEDFGEGVLNFV